MIDDPNRFNADKSPYERPAAKYRCGRAAGWGTACSNGPNGQGKCGGEYECEPVKKGDRFECRRPMRAGGPCEHGPRPDGSCPNHRPPCMPKRSLRYTRGRIAWLVIAALIALIALTSTFSDTPGKLKNLMVNAGSLSSLHEGFTQGEGCHLCHEDNGEKMHGWLKASFKDKDITGNCLQCHTFAEHDRKAHNTVFPSKKYPQAPDLGDLACTKCHIEHKGKDHDLKALTNEQCASCHSKKFETFPEDHPAFAADFPYQVANTIRFNHGSHLSKHFEDAKYKDKAPVCTSCHEISEATREVKPGSYEKLCASCHASQIPEAEMTLFELPIMGEASIKLDDIAEFCGLTAEQKEEAKARLEELKNDGSIANGEEIPALTALLVNATADDQSSYAQPVEELMKAMTENGIVPLIEKLKGEDDALNTTLLTGLAPEQVKQAACSWITNAEYERLGADVLDEVAMPGWRADTLSLKYRPVGHADPVIKAWIEHLIKLRANTAEDSEVRAQVDAAYEAFVNRKEGVGKCAKCHAMAVPAGADPKLLEGIWHYEAQSERPHTHFKHQFHISLLGVNESCKTCHKLNLDADYDKYFVGVDPDPGKYVSNFSPIPKETCGQCHRPGVVSTDCQICHKYHKEPRMKDVQALVQQIKEKHEAKK